MAGFQPSDRFRLFWGTLDLGEVVAESSDFPNVCGHWTPTEQLSSAEAARIKQYVAYSAEAGELFDATDGGEEWEAFVAEHDPAFQDLIDSEDWWLVRPDGTRAAIVIPNFLPNHELVWRFDVRRG